MNPIPTSPLNASEHQQMDLSIIVPVYNVEKYIRTCIESIYKQELDETRFEVIIVNDGTKDKSMEMIADIIAQHPNIKVINQENQGLSVARNKGMAIAKGEYILMIDSDDILIDGSVKPLLEGAFSSKADMIVADFVQMDDEEINNLCQQSFNQQATFEVSEIAGSDLLTADYCRWYWRSIYRRAFLLENHISFVPGILAQDVPFTNECFLKVKKCYRTTWLVNIYRKGHKSAASHYSLRRASNTTIAIQKSLELAESLQLSPETKYKEDEVLYSLFNEHIYAITSGHLKDFAEISKAISFLKEQIPHITFKHNKKQRMWSLMYNQLPTTLFSFIFRAKQIFQKRFKR